MNSKKTAAFFAMLFLLGVALLYSFGGTEQKGEKLVLYNGFAYYEQDVKLLGKDGAFELPYGVEPDSVKLRMATAYVVSQYIQEANITTSSSLLSAYVGKQVTVYDVNGREIKGTLLKFDGSIAYVETAEGLYMIRPEYTMLPNFEGNVSDTNTSVVFKVSAAGEGKLTYLMDSISWNPDYTLYLNGNGGTLSLSGAVNNYAKDYSNVSLSLFYGQVKRTYSGYYYDNYYDYARGSPMAENSGGSKGADYTPQAVFEYYKFDLGNVELKRGSSQFTLFDKNAGTIKKTYEMSVNGYSYGYDYEPSALEIKLSINNSAQNGLGVALPSGKIRVMDQNGFVGEDYVSETPKDEVLELSVGSAFDVIGMSKLVNQSTQEVVSCDPRVMAAKNAPLCVNEKGGIYTNTYTYEATVENKKGESADVVLTYNPYGDWVMIDESMPSEKVSQNKVQWKFTMPAGSEKTLRFTIRTKSGTVPIYYADAGTEPAYYGG